MTTQLFIRKNMKDEHFDSQYYASELNITTLFIHGNHVRANLDMI